MVPRRGVVGFKGGSIMKFWSLLAALLVAVLVTGLQAEDKKEGKEVTLKGTLACGKCTLKDDKGEKLTPDACSNILQVKEGGKIVNYYIDDQGKAESYHEGICPAGKKAECTVIGVVTEKDGKKHIKASKVEVK
jgi:hypothetical protein